jgi:hypothetical protein
MPLKFNPLSGEFDLVMSPGHGTATIELDGDTGSATPTAGGVITLAGGTGVTTAASGSTVTFTAGGSVAINFDADTGTATPALNAITMAGDATQGLVTSATGDTVTFTNSNATTAQIGVSAFSSSAEVTAGSISTKTVVPSSLNQKLGDQTQYAVITGGGSTGNLESTAAMTNGMLAIGSTSATPVAAVLTAGAGVSIVNGAGSITISSTSGGITWNEETGTSATIAVANGYISNNVGLVTFTLPATAAVGDDFRIVGKGAGLFKIAQNASQTIHFISSDTTTGVGGSLTAIEQYAAIEIVCITANTDFAVLDSAGNYTIV